MDLFLAFLVILIIGYAVGLLHGEQWERHGRPEPTSADQGGRLPHGSAPGVPERTSRREDRP